MRNVITLYDIPGTGPPDKAWSPNVWKARLILNYKRLPYRTEWVEYPAIERLCKRLGVAPGGTHADGTAFYTLPVIHDPATRTSVAESFAIARYLDETYPATTPAVVPRGTHALQAATEHALQMIVGPLMRRLLVVPTLEQLRPRSQAFYRKAREVDCGRLEDLEPGVDEAWGALRAGFSEVAGWLAEGGEGRQERLLFMGDSVCFVDIVLAARLLWAKRILGEQSMWWMDMMAWDGGRWARFMARFEEYEVVH